MNDVLYQRIEKSARFKTLVKKRQNFATLLSLIMLVLYVGFILLIAFYPAWLGTPLYQRTVITRGIVTGVGLIVVSFLLTGIYVWRANGEFDRLTRELHNEVKE